MALHTYTVSKAQALMRQSPEAGWTISQLAAECNTSPTVLKDAFREEVGMPVGTWYRRLRMDCACQRMLADTDKSIAAVAAEMGYANPSKFSRAFRSCKGCSPSEWRAQNTTR